MRQTHQRTCLAALVVLIVLGLLAMIPARAFAQATAAAAAVQRLTAKEPQITLQVGQRQTVKVKVEPATADGQPLRYESGNPGFFTVDDKGTLHGVHEGASMLAIIAPNGVRTEARVEVVAAGEKTAAPAPTTSAAHGGRGGRGAPDEDIVLGNAGGPIEVGRYQRIIAYVLPYEVVGPNPFTISSSNPSVLAAMDEAKVVHALKEGTATVTAATLDGKHRVSVSYTVVPARTENRPADKTYMIEPQRFGIRCDDASEAAAKANSAGLYEALRHTAEHGFTRLLLEPKKLLYVEPKDTIHMVSNVQLDLNGSEIRLRPNDYPRYVAFLFAEKDHATVLKNASIVNGTLTGERDEKEKFLPGWAKKGETEGGCTIIFEEGTNNGIRNLTVRKSIGFNMSSGLGSKSHGVVNFSQNPVKARNMELGGFDSHGQPTEAKGRIRTKTPLDVSKVLTPYYNIGFPVGYMGYPFVNSRIYDAYFFDKEMKLLSAERGRLRYRQYALPKEAAYLHLAFYASEVPTNVNGDFGDAFAFVENRAMPIQNYIIGCTIEDNYSCGFAACGGQEWLIQNNTFRGNGGRMPGSDIDWEDGWEYMQGDLVEGNTFESRTNVIVCAGGGAIFRNNTFRGGSLFYGRTQDYSLLENVFEKAAGDKAFDVKLSLASSSDIYCAGNRFKDASVSYTRQHVKPPFVGTYEATFTNETFDNTAINPGPGGRLIHCTIRNGKGSRISATLLDQCTIEAGSYLAGGTIRQSTLTDAALGALPDMPLRIEDSKLKNPTFTASSACEGVEIENCQITLDGKPPLVAPNNMAAFTLVNSSVKIDAPADTANWAMVGGWDASNAESTITLDRVRLTVRDGFQGYLHKFAWYPPATAAKKITYHIRQTDLSKLRRTDEKGERSNTVFNTDSR